MCVRTRVRFEAEVETLGQPDAVHHTQQLQRENVLWVGEEGGRERGRETAMSESEKIRRKNLKKSAEKKIRGARDLTTHCTDKASISSVSLYECCSENHPDCHT
jgi:hypothetical protein